MNCYSILYYMHCQKALNWSQTDSPHLQSETSTEVQVQLSNLQHRGVEIVQNEMQNQLKMMKKLTQEVN